MLALAGLLLELLELLELALARLVEQALLDVGGQLDREDAEVARAVVHLDRGVTRRTRRLLVRREQRVLEGGDERALLDSLVALDLADGFEISWVMSRSLVDQICPHDLGIRDLGFGRRPRRRPSRSPRPRREPRRAAFVGWCEA